MKKNKTMTHDDEPTVVRGAPLMSANDSASRAPNKEDFLQAAAAKLGKLFSQEASGTTLVRYDIGAEVNGLHRAETTHGSGLVAQVAARIGRDSDSMYAYASVAALLPRDEFRELAERPNPAGLPLSFSHFIELAWKTGKRGRGLSREQWTSFFERALNEKMSIRVLGGEVSKSFKSDAPSKDKKKRPSLESVVKIAKRVGEEMSSIDKLSAKIEKSGAAKSGAELTAAIKELEEISVRTTSALNRLRAVQTNEVTLPAAAE